MNQDINVVRVPVGLTVPPAMYEAQNRFLSRFNESPRADNLQTAINSQNTALILAISGAIPKTLDDWQNIPTESYAGTLTLLILQTPWHNTAHIEEVIVDADYEGKGVGKQLLLKAIQLGRENDVKQFDLTSSSGKVAAQALYEKTGFKKRETNNWRYED